MSFPSFDLDAGFNATTTSPSPSLESSSTLPLFPIHYPITHFPAESVIPGIPDVYLSIISPFAFYWAVSIWFAFLDWYSHPFWEKYRIHESEEITKRNQVTRYEVVKAVLVQQAVQTCLGLWWLGDEVTPLTEAGRSEELWNYHGYISTIVGIVLGSEGAKGFMNNYGVEVTNWIYWWGVPLVQFAWSFFVLDTWQYFIHRYFHTNRFLYKHIHSVHHRLYVPYAYGALYNHPFEGFLFDSLGAVVAETLSFMSVRQATLLFAISSAKTVDDHGGYKIPFDPLQALFGNNADYHDIHHQVWGIKKNFSQPYFTHWDDILGTRMDRHQAPVRSYRAVLSKVQEPSAALSAATGTTAASPAADDAVSVTPSSSESDRSSERGDSEMPTSLKATGTSVRAGL